MQSKSTRRAVTKADKRDGDDRQREIERICAEHDLQGFLNPAAPLKDGWMKAQGRLLRHRSPSLPSSDAESSTRWVERTWERTVDKFCALQSGQLTAEFSCISKLECVFKLAASRVS